MSDHTDGTSGGGGSRFGGLLNSMQRGIQSGVSAMKAGSSSTFYPTTLSAQKTLASGWLKKQGGMVRSWHRRYFVLKEDATLYYFSSEDESRTPAGSIQLLGNRVIELPQTNEPEKFLFEIVPAGGRGSGEVYQLWSHSDDDRKNWVKMLRRVMFAERGGAIFGQCLEDTMMYDHGRRKVPSFIEQCVTYLTEHGLDTEGIFRLPGRSLLIKELKEAYDSCEIPTLDPIEVDVHTVASLLKLYLRELPSPLIPYHQYEAVMKIVTRELPLNPEESLENLEKKLLELPQVNYNMMQYLCRFLSEIVKHEPVNKMTAMNLATCFVHSFIRPEDDDPALLMGTSNGRTQVTYILIVHCEQMFRHEYTPQGGAIKVDNMFDLEVGASGDSFRASSHGHQSARPMQKDLLLELDLNRQSVANLPAPIDPTPEDQPLDNPDSSSQFDHRVQRGLSRKGSKRTAVIIDKEEESDIESVHSSVHSSTTDTSHLNTPVEDYFAAASPSGEIQPSPEREVTKISPKREAPIPPRPVMRPEMRAKTMPTIPPRPQSVQIPSVPPRPNKVQKHASSINVTSNGTAQESSSLDKQAKLSPVDFTELDSLLIKDTSGYTSEQLQDHVKVLCKELTIQRTQVKEARQAMVDLEHSHQQKILAMAQKLDKEKEATQEAVDRIMGLQAKMNEYVMIYGPLES